MTSLWIVLAIMIALALLFVAVPVWRFRGGDPGGEIEARKQANIGLFRQREEELRQDRADGLINDEQYEKLEHELQRSFLHDMQQFEKEERRASAIRHYRLIPLLLALLVPLFSVLIYQGWGSGRDLRIPQLLERIQTAQTEEQQTTALLALADFLQERYERTDDVQTGYMLGTLYIQLERFDRAVATLRSLAELVPAGPDRATILGELAQAEYLQAGQEITPQVQGTMDRALSLNPNQPSVMSLLAIDAFLREDFAAAVEYWRRQLSQVAPGSAQAQALQQRIARVMELIPEGELPTENQVAENAGASVEVHVEVAEELRGQVTGDMQVFVFARNADSPMPMPVAARTFPASELPLTVTLDDSNAMIQGMTLSTAENVIVGARISRSGEATARPGDMQVLSEPFALGEREDPLSLTIDEIVP